MSLEGPSGGNGKWATNSGVPKRGWSCDFVEVLEGDLATCEMCETVKIRFLHVMTHPNYPTSLSCGEICAGHMESDLARANRRDKKMKSKASRRKRFPSLKGWAKNANGNYQIKADGFRITVFRKGIIWGGVVNCGDVKQWTREKFSTLEEAQMATFDAMMLLDEKLEELRRVQHGSF